MRSHLLLTSLAVATLVAGVFAGSPPTEPSSVPATTSAGVTSINLETDSVQSLQTELGLLKSELAVTENGERTPTHAELLKGLHARIALIENALAIRKAPNKVPAAARLIIKDADPKVAAAVTLAKVDLSVVLAGPLAETTAILTFKNSTNRILEGELEFPLPEGAAVTGYGLDINGVMVDGVAVEKERARQIFESEERRGVDPGILEQTKGNNFKTRVYPIPANGTRTIKIKYVSDMVLAGETATYSVPLQFDGAIKDAKVSVAATGVKESPKVAGLEGIKFEKTGESFAGSKEFHDVELAGALTITVANPGGKYVLVEKRERSFGIDDLAARSSADRGETYFLATVPPRIIAPTRILPVIKPGRLLVYWDASLSREKSDKTAELDFLKQLVATMGDIQVDVAAFRNVMDPAVTFVIKKGDASELIKYLETLTYDGATNLSAITFGKNYAFVFDHGVEDRTRQDYTYALLFTDGIATLGTTVAGPLPLPVYTVTGETKADFAALRGIAESSPGGKFVNLQRTKPDAAVTQLTSAGGYGLISITSDAKQVAEVFPRGSRPNEALVVSGKLLADEATITLNYGVGGEIMDRETITLKRQDVGGTGLVSRYWAGQKLADLSAMPEKNADEILKLGREFNMVTPRTSLMVLENIDQYVRYRVVPPKSLPELYQQFAARIEQEGKDKAKTEEAKITRVLAMWKARTEWWEKDFAKVLVIEVPKKDKQLDARNNSVGGMIAPIGPPGGGSAAAADSTVAPPAASVGVSGRATGATSAAPAITGNVGGTTGGGGHAATTQPAVAGGDNAQQLMQNQLQLHSETDSITLSGGTLQLPRVRASEALSSPQPNLGASAQLWTSPANSITLKPWDPKTPYLDALKAATADKAYAVFIEQRKTYGASPAFFLDCADFFLKLNQNDMAIRILTDVAELKLESAPLLRIAAYRLLQIGHVDLAIDLFEKAKAIRPDEPQSWRDLAQAYAARGETRYATVTDEDFNSEGRRWGIEDFQKAMDLYQHVVMNHWERFDEIETTALMEANELWARIQRLNGYDLMVKSGLGVKNPLDARLVKNLDCDLRIVMTWDADNTDIDLHVIEPTGEEAFYNNPRTQVGGFVSKDFTQGYGPEEYFIHNARPGKYKISAVYYGSNQQLVSGPVTVQADVITNFGRKDEKHQAMTLRLADKKETVMVGEVEIGK